MTLKKGQIITVKIREHAYGYSPIYLEPGETVTIVNPKAPAVFGKKPYFAYCERVIDGNTQRFGIFPDNIAAVKPRAPLGRSKAARSRKVEISFHSASTTGSNAHPAICVKVHHLPWVETSDEIRTAAYDQITEQFWIDAGTIALEHGYSGAFSEGRSNGWLVPFTQHNSKGELVTKWTGQGPDKGYPVYPNVEDAKERRQFVEFRTDIETLLKESIAQYQELALDLAKEGKAV